MDSSDSNALSPESNRRGFMGAAGVAMTGGLAASYGTLGGIATQFLFPASENRVWLFVAEANAIAPGGAFAYESPTGLKVTIQRAAASDASRPPEVSEFSALSSVCPHLGCRVHWESQNRRFFCPCHNGVFDAEGKATAGPPADGGQKLANYSLAIEKHLLFIELPVETLGASPGAFVSAKHGS